MKVERTLQMQFLGSWDTCQEISLLDFWPNRVGAFSVYSWMKARYPRAEASCLFLIHDLSKQITASTDASAFWGRF